MPSRLTLLALLPLQVDPPATATAAKIARRRAQGKLSIRERIAALVDPDSWHEIGRIAGGADRSADGKLTDFTPGNFVLGTAKLQHRMVIVSGEVRAPIQPSLRWAD